MISRRLALTAVLGAVVVTTGCHSTTSNRVAYATQPAVVATPAPGCATPVVAAPVAVGAVPPPPAGFVR